MTVVVRIQVKSWIGHIYIYLKQNKWTKTKWPSWPIYLDTDTVIGMTFLSFSHTMHEHWQHWALPPPAFPPLKKKKSENDPVLSKPTSFTFEDVRNGLPVTSKAMTLSCCCFYCRFVFILLQFRWDANCLWGRYNFTVELTSVSTSTNSPCGKLNFSVELFI